MVATWSEFEVDGSRIIVSLVHPVAVVVRPEAADVVVSWPDLDVGLFAPSATALRAPTGVWLLYRSAESEVPLPSGRAAAAVHVSPRGEVTRFEGLTHELVGTTRHGLWLGSTDFPGYQGDRASRTDSEVAILSADGSMRSIATTLPLWFAVDDGVTAHVGAYASAADGPSRPRRDASAAEGSVSIVVPDDLSQVSSLTELALQPYDAQVLIDGMALAAPRAPEGLPPDPGIRWNPVELPQEHVDRAIAEVLREFEHLADYWQGSDGKTRPLVRGLGDPHVAAIGEWPRTRIEVTFTHPLYPGGRLRRTLRVFDDAGRINSNVYASIHLMEDLPSAGRVDLSAAVDGVLDI